MIDDDSGIAFAYPTLDGGAARWVERVSKGDRKNWVIYEDAALVFVRWTLEALGSANPTPSQLHAAFDAAAKRADGTDRYPFDEQIGSFSTGSAGWKIAFMLHDVWEHGPAMREWVARRVSCCPAQLRWLSAQPVDQLKADRWDGPPSAEWPRFALVDGATWEEWTQPRFWSPHRNWARAAVTAFVARLETNLETMPFAAAADEAHAVFEVDYRSRLYTMSEYTREPMDEAARVVRDLERYWPRFAELRTWAVASTAATAYGTNRFLRPLDEV